MRRKKGPGKARAPMVMSYLTSPRFFPSDQETLPAHSCEGSFLSARKSYVKAASVSTAIRDSRASYKGRSAGGTVAPAACRFG